MNDILEMTQKDFLQLPRIESETYKNAELEFDSLIIVPTGKVHDSGYGTMGFVLADGDKCLGLYGGGSDVVNINGIGGDGYDWARPGKAVPTSMKIIDWSIDVLPKSRLLRLFCSYRLKCGGPLSSFEVYAIGKRR